MVRCLYCYIQTSHKKNFYDFIKCRGLEKLDLVEHKRKKSKGYVCKLGRGKERREACCGKRATIGGKS
jgi:hypothetical protein